MGLLESLVNTPESLRVWQLSGVRYFLLPEGGAEQTAARPGAQADGQPGEQPVGRAAGRPAVAANPAAWPTPWPAIFAKTPRRARLCITYAALGFDLTGRSDRRRSALWHKLLRDLGLVGHGLVAFWPAALPDGDALVPQPGIFGAGLSLLAPNVLAFFGDPGACRLSADGAAGVPCLVLPDPEELLAGDQEVWNHVLAALGHVAVSG